MIICDGCHARNKTNKNNCFNVIIEQTHETYHLCNDCVELMKAAVFKPLRESQPEQKEKPVKKGRLKGKQ